MIVATGPAAGGIARPDGTGPRMADIDPAMVGTDRLTTDIVHPTTAIDHRTMGIDLRTMGIDLRTMGIAALRATLDRAAVIKPADQSAFPSASLRWERPTLNTRPYELGKRIWNMVLREGRASNLRGKTAVRSVNGPAMDAVWPRSILKVRSAKAAEILV